MACWPVNWPIGSGDRFRGVIDRRSHQVILFLRAERGRTSEEKVLSVEEARSSGAVEPELLDAALEELELLEAAGNELDLELVHAG